MVNIVKVFMWCEFLLLILLSSSALGKIPSFSDEEEGSGYEFLDEEFSGSYSDFLDEYLGGSGGDFPLGFDAEGSSSDDEREEDKDDDFPLLEEDPLEDDIHFVDVVGVKHAPPEGPSSTPGATVSSSTTESNIIPMAPEEPDSTFLFANRFLFFVLYGAAIMVLLLAILLVICLLLQCRKKRRDMNKNRVLGINNSLSKSSKDSIIIDCYRIHKNPLGQKV